MKATWTTQMGLVAGLLVANFFAANLPAEAGAERPADSARIADADDHLSIRDRQRQAARRSGELRRQMRETLRQEATMEGPENLQAIEDLIDLYITLRLDDSLGDIQRRQLTGRVRSRLLRAKKRLANEQESAEGDAPEDPTRSPQRDIEKQAESDDSGGDAASARLAQRTGRRTAETVAQLSQVVLAQQGAVGPAGQAAVGAAAAAPAFAGDYGPDLVDLIETVIAPSTWERNGGPGSIYYYRPLRVLVIRQTGEIHGQIGGAIGGLRRAGN